MSKTYDFQSVEVPYPKNLYGTALWFDDEKNVPTVLYSLKKELYEIENDAAKLVNAMENSLTQNNVKRQILILELSFEKLHPLKKDLWDDPVVELSDLRRNMEFMDSFGKKELYEVVVVPVIFRKKDKVTFEYLAAFPYLKISTNVDDLMHASRIFVSPEAKNAGIYSIKNTYRYDTKEFKGIN